MFLLEEASLLELNQSEGVSNEKLVENFWVFFFFFLHGQKSFGGASCGAGMKGRREEALQMEPLDHASQCRGCPCGPCQPGLLRSPPPPSPNSFQRPLARAKSHPSPRSQYKTSPSPAEPPQESSSAAGTGTAVPPGCCGLCLRGICHQAKAPRSSGDAVSESGFVSPQPAGKGLNMGPCWKAKK